jgi:hypothetical protein
MIAWGDDYPAQTHLTNVRDFANLADAIEAASLIRSRADAKTRFLVPVNVDGLARPRGVALAKRRLAAGADLLLSQPPTTDPDETLERQGSLLEKAGLDGKVLLNVFPFRDAKDVKHYEDLFGWKLSDNLHAAAARGESGLVELARRTVRRLRDDGYPGVYVTTRGTPALAEVILSCAPRPRSPGPRLGSVPVRLLQPEHVE